MSEGNPTLAARIRMGRAELDVTQEEFGRKIAAALNLEKPVRGETVYRWERTGKVDRHLLPGIAAVLRWEEAPRIPTSQPTLSAEAPQPPPKPPMTAASAIVVVRRLLREALALLDDL